MIRSAFVALLVLTGFGACMDVVPRAEVQAFEANQRAIARYESFLTQRLLIDTEIGKIYAHLLPDDHGYVDQLLRWVGENSYDGVRVHRSIVDPVPFGIQFGDQRTKGVYGHDFVWADETPIPGVPVAGTASFSDGVSQVNSVPYSVHAYDVVMVGRPGMAEVGPHIFIALGDELMMEDSYAVIGHVVTNRDAVKLLAVGTTINSVRFVDKDPRTVEGALPKVQQRQLALHKVKPIK